MASVQMLAAPQQSRARAPIWRPSASPCGSIPSPLTQRPCRRAGARGFHAAEATQISDDSGRAPKSGSCCGASRLRGLPRPTSCCFGLGVGRSRERHGRARAVAVPWLSALIALPAMPRSRSARSALRARRLNMDVPISLGIILASTMSLVQTIAGGELYFRRRDHADVLPVIPPPLHQEDGEP